jgi:ribosomal protein S18 acetylase RimI-like enzyme
METRIILADKSNLEQLAVLFDGYRQFYRQAPDLQAARSFLEERFTHRDSIIFIALNGDKALGFAQLYPIFSSVRMSRAWLLNDLYVIPEARRSGTGTLLMDAAAEHGKNSDAGFLMLQTEISNTTAQSLYEKKGWIRDQDCYYYYLSTF